MTMSDMAGWMAEQERKESLARSVFLERFDVALRYARKIHPHFVDSIGVPPLRCADDPEDLCSLLLEEVVGLCEELQRGDLAMATESAARIAAVAARSVGPEGQRLLVKPEGKPEVKTVEITEVYIPNCSSETQNEATSPTLPAKEPADSTRPKWCNVGQWVRIYGRINRRYLGEITRTHPGLRMVEVTVVEDGKTEVHSCDPTDLRPVRFRPYTFDEALGLLGKTIRYKVGDIIPRASLVTDVAMTDGDAYVILNGTGTPRWQHLHATIDGVPFGVPEIDTDAEKEAVE